MAYLRGSLSFGGDSDETRFHELKFKLLRNSYLSAENKTVCLNELRQFVSENENPLYRQHLLYENAMRTEDTGQQLSLLQDALHCTLKNFDINKITEYRLSWTELTILNNIAYMQRYTETPYQGILYFRQLLEYQKKIKPDCILQNQTFTVTLSKYFHFLYVQKHFREMADLFEYFDFSIVKHSIEYWGSICFYQAQAYGECSLYSQMPLLACYSCAIDNIRECGINSDALIRFLAEDFSITINY